MTLRVVVADSPGQRRDRVARLLRGAAGLEATVVGDRRDIAATAKAFEADILLIAADLPRAAETITLLLSSRALPVLALAGADGHGTAGVLAAGALGVVAVPVGRRAEAEFVDRVRALATVRMVTRRRPPSPSEQPGDREHGRPVEIIAIAASTGGPPALVQVLRDLPREPPVPILVVQHIAPGFTPGFTAWLDRSIEQRARVPESGDVPQPGEVLVSPDDAHMVWSDGTVQLVGGPPVHGHRPSASILLHSVAPLGPAGVAVILTGMGDDGADGAVTMRDAGGTVICQDRATSVVHGMPGATIAAGGASIVLPLQEIGNRVVQLLEQRPRTPAISQQRHEG